MNIVHYSIPLGISFLFFIIFLNFCIYLFYKTYFTQLQRTFDFEKKVLFEQFLKPKNKTLKNKHRNSSNCIICFEKMNDNSICELDCHCLDKFYHIQCLRSWIQKKSSCPICRKIIE